MKLRTLIGALTGRRYHWRVQLTYRDKLHRQVGPTVTCTVSMHHPSSIDNHRMVKRMAVPRVLLPVLPPVCRCNGTVDMEPLVHLGWF